MVQPKRQRRIAEEAPASDDEEDPVEEEEEVAADEEEDEDGEDGEEEEEEQEDDEEDEDAEDAEEEEDGDDQDSDNDESEDDDDDEDGESRTSSRHKRKRSGNRPNGNSSGRRRGNIDNTGQKPSHGLMTSASVANTPRPSGANQKNGASSSRRRRGKNDGSESDDDDDKEDEAFAASTIPGSEYDKRPFKDLDVFAEIPLRVTRKIVKKGQATAPEVMAKKYSIPAPPTTSAALSFEKVLSGNYEPPTAYIRFEQDMIKPQDYEMTVEDDAWLKARHPKLSPNVFEKVFTAFEIVTGTNIALTQAKAFPIVQKVDPSIPRPVSDDLHSYWMARRGKNKRPLLRRYWPVTPAEDQTPTLTFRPREKERYRLRKKRMNDVESYEKLCFLKKDFDCVKDMLKLVHAREEMKKLDIELTHAEYLERLNPTGQRPACLNTPLVQTSDIHDPYEAQMELMNTPSLTFQGSNRTFSSSMNNVNRRVSMETSRFNEDAALKNLKKSTKRRGEEEAYRNTSSTSGLTSASFTPAVRPEKKEISPSVPLPRFLLEPSIARFQSRLRTLFPKTSKRPMSVKMDYLPKYSRNRRLVFERVLVPRDQNLPGPSLNKALKLRDPFVPSQAVAERMNTLLTEDVDSEDETVVSLDKDIIKCDTAPGVTPKFQLVISL